MILATSALLAILRDEPRDGERCMQALLEARRVTLSAASLVEAGIVLGRLGKPLVDQLYRFVSEAEIEVAAFDERQARVAIDAYQRFGKGSRGPAQLNFGDCISYALARMRDEPLLFVDKDFAQTDVSAAL